MDYVILQEMLMWCFISLVSIVAFVALFYTVFKSNLGMRQHNLVIRENLSDPDIQLQVRNAVVSNDDTHSDGTAPSICHIDEPDVSTFKGSDEDFMMTTINHA